MKEDQERARVKRRQRWPTTADNERLEAIATFMRIREECDALGDLLLLYGVAEPKLFEKIEQIEEKAYSGERILKEATRDT